MKKLVTLIIALVFLMGLTSVPAFAASPEEAAAALGGEALTQDREPLCAVTKSLILPSKSEGVAITWESDSNAVNLETGEVTRSLFTDTEVTLTADFGSGVTKDFKLTILAKNKKVIYSDNFAYGETNMAIQELNTNWKKSIWMKDVDTAQTTVEIDSNDSTNHMLKSERIDSPDNGSNHHNYGYYEFPLDSLPKGNVTVSYKIKATSSSSTFDIKFGGAKLSEDVYSYDSASVYIKDMQVRYTSGNGMWLDSSVNFDFDQDSASHAGAGSGGSTGANADSPITAYDALARIYLAPFRTALTVNEIDDMVVYELIPDEDILAEATELEKMQYVEAQINNAEFTEEDSHYITENLTLPEITLPEGVSLEWKSTNENILAADGSVTRGRSAENAALIATISADGFDDIVVNVPFTVSEVGTTLIKNENFDSYSVGEKLNDKTSLWGQYPSPTANNPIQGDIVKEAEKGNVAKISRVNGGSGQVFFKASSTDDSNRFIGEAEMKFTEPGQFDIRLVEGTNTKRLYTSARVYIEDLEDPSKNYICYSHYDTDGINGRGYNFYGVPANEWVKFTFDVNRLSRTFDLYQNGVKRNDRPCPLYFTHADAAGLPDDTIGKVGQWVIFDVPTNGTAMFVDNVSVRAYGADYANAQQPIADLLFSIPREIYNRGFYDGYVLPETDVVTYGINDEKVALNANTLEISKYGMFDLTLSATSGNVTLNEVVELRATKIVITGITYADDAIQLEESGTIESINYNGNASGEKLVVAIFDGGKLDSVNVVALTSQNVINNVAELNITTTAKKPNIKMYLYDSQDTIKPMMAPYRIYYAEPEV